LLPRVQSVIVVHPPHVKAVTEARLMTDKIAAFTLARLLAANWLKGICAPPAEWSEQPYRGGASFLTTRGAGMIMDRMEPFCNHIGGDHAHNHAKEDSCATL
jgi:hypothetical protein